MIKRTDLAMEVRESFRRDNVEVKGVVLAKEHFKKGDMHVTTVDIKDERGSKAMGKPQGVYVTVESPLLARSDEDHTPIVDKIAENVESICDGLTDKSILVVGLGNREVTSDSLGPKVTESLFVTRHIDREFGTNFMRENELGLVSAIAPGVMGQTGMEAIEIIKGLVEQTEPELIVVIDALAARSLSRLCTTVQITDTGISPGSGVGNHRKELSENSLGVPVIAIGVPTVVDANTIVSDHLETVLSKQGYNESEIGNFLKEVLGQGMDNVFVTPKNIDESVLLISNDLSNVLNKLIHKK
ncbi:MAG: GPR endopeptidase [Lachnoclostridium sp.]|nr:GPR endopeptidase [Lachnoclostridium sp.]